MLYFWVIDSYQKKKNKIPSLHFELCGFGSTVIQQVPLIEYLVWARLLTYIISNLLNNLVLI